MWRSAKHRGGCEAVDVLQKQGALVPLAHEAGVLQRRQRRIILGDEEEIQRVGGKQGRDALWGHTERLVGSVARRTGPAVSVEGLFDEEPLAQLDQVVGRQRTHGQCEEQG